jgi:hypothetical protein
MRDSMINTNKIKVDTVLKCKLIKVYKSTAPYLLPTLDSVLSIWVIRLSLIARGRRADGGLIGVIYEVWEASVVA